MNDIKPLPKPLQKILQSYGVNPDDLQIAVKVALENLKSKENEKNDL